MNAATITALVTSLVGVFGALTALLRAQAAHERINDAQAARTSVRHSDGTMGT